LRPVGPARAGVPAEPDTLTGRPRRADALRNRERVIAVARTVFACAKDTVTLEGIAREAGVGIGTLYRHFPTREALVEAVYAAELDDVATSASTLLEQLPPEVALRAWLEPYAQFTATKRGMIDMLRVGGASGRITTPATRERITAVIATFLAAGARGGSLRADVYPEDVTTLLLGVFLSTATNTHSTSKQKGRLLDLLVDALRLQR